MVKKVKTVYIVPLNVGRNIEVPKGSKITFYDPRKRSEDETAIKQAQQKERKKTMEIVKDILNTCDIKLNIDLPYWVNVLMEDELEAQ